MDVNNIKNKRILSGITATGVITLGNYIGAIKNFLTLQDNNDLYIFVANLHAIVSPIDKLTLRNNIKSLIAMYFACGLDPNKSTIFIQSDVLEHAQLGHILLCHTTIGELSRMTQYKDKSFKAGNGSEFIPSGLLTYPTLMAADILLYDADYVPVGKDQKQHIELARNIASRMNIKYDQEFLKVPEDFVPNVGFKIKNLQNPLEKMSKSSNEIKSYISMLDEPKIIVQKIKAAVTDSENKVYYNEKNKPGISNLMSIYAALNNKDIKAVELEFENKNYGEFKQAVWETIIDCLQPIQEKYHQLLKSSDLDDYIELGAKKARNVAYKKLKKDSKCYWHKL